MVQCPELTQLPGAAQLQNPMAVRAIEGFFNGNGIQLPRLEFEGDVAMGAVPFDAYGSAHRLASLGL